MESLVMGSGFWQGKRVFITGHTGFKGSWLALWLQHLGAVVTGYALQAPTEPNMFASIRMAEGMHSIYGDVRDGKALTSAMAEARPEVVFHLAAQSLVRLSYREPVETFQTNVMGSVNLLESVRQVDSVRAVVLVTSDKCYENREWMWGYRENEAMGGHDPYSSSKGCAELVTAAYRNSYFSAASFATHQVALASARAGNVIGGGDWADDRLVPDAMRAFAAGQALRIRNPQAIRPWQHVLEPLAGYMLLAQALCEKGASFAEPWNFGPADDGTRSVAWIADKLVTLWGASASLLTDDGEKPHEAQTLRLDCSKAHHQLGWQPRWTLEQALDKIVSWHRLHLEGHDMRAFSLRQIEEFQG